MSFLSSIFSKAATIAVGARAPPFSLRDQHSNLVSLSDFQNKKNVVLYFYPKDDTPGCTKESCSFRDSYEAFRDMGAEVLGVSSDSVASHKAFAEKYRLPFSLLSDEDGKLRAEYGVPSTLGVIPGRVTFVIDKEGIVRHTFNSQTDSTKHVEESRRILESLK